MPSIELCQSYSASELAEELMGAGIDGNATLQQVCDGTFKKGEKGEGGIDDRDVEDAVRYAREGNAELAIAIFGRFIPRALMPSVERALA